MPPSAKPADDLIGQTIAVRYRIISQLGVGGMGTAYRAWDEQSGVPVVIKIPKKVFLEDPKFAERFMREIRLLQGLSHPHIVPIVDVGEHEGLPFLVMRFLPGGSLSNRRLRDEEGRVKPNPPGMLHLWLPAVAAALDYVHAPKQNVVHRDVKPANIFFDAFWGAYLGDFGIAKIVGESDLFDREHTLTATGMGIGTPDYMAPEQFAPKAKVDGRADQYALAVIVHEMLAGVRPFTGESANLILEVLTKPAPRLKRSGLPPSLVEAVQRGLAKRPEDRFATCSEFAAVVLRDVPPLDAEPGVARLLCPKCANLLKLPESAAGRKGSCPKCQTEMKVAADLGAMWLLDEARRQEDATSGTGVDVQAIETFRPVSGTTPSGKASRGARRGILAWIDGHGLMVGSVLSLVAMALGFLLVSGDDPQPGGKDQAAIRRLQAENQAVEKRLAEAVTRENLLRNQLEAASEATEKPKQKQPEPQPQQLTNSVGIKLNLIPSGTFMMGSEDGEADEKPVHEVRITKPFYLGVTEVTNAQWKRVMGGEPPSMWKDDDRPVEMVTWDDAVEFCQKLSELPEERSARRSYRLPTEAEWEYACRAGTTTRYSFGDDEKMLLDFAWFGWMGENSLGETHLVGKKQANPWGLHDMHGNVWEWCSDNFGTYATAVTRDNASRAHSSDYVRRGGGYVDTSMGCRSSARGGLERSRRGTDLGFRLALSPSESGQPAEGSKPTSESGGSKTEQVATGTSGEAVKTVNELAKLRPDKILALPPLKNSAGIGLKLIPSGTFMMGSKDGEADEKPVHEVWITKPFYLSVTEVTNAQWKQVMGGEPPSVWKDDVRPVEQVSWNDANAFCQKLSGIPEEQKAGRVYRLPTEAEWEYACRAGTKTRFSCGDDDATLVDFAWFGVNAGGQTHAVGQKKPNPWGLHDMHGNVWEWCSDWYGSYGAVGAADPTGPASGSSRVPRGGCWGYAAGRCRSANRDWNEPSVRDLSLGFRLALSPSGASPPEAGKSAERGLEEASGGEPPEQPMRSGPPGQATAGGQSSTRKDTIAAEPSPGASGDTRIVASAEEILARPPITNSIGMKLKLIPAGTFQMGSNDEDSNGKPVHEVTITKPFYIGVYEATNAQWRNVMSRAASRWNTPNRPVDRVSWSDAIEFCRKLSELPKERAAGRVYRLPTEAEWEYACRAGTTTRYSFGDDEAALGDHAWFRGNSERQTHPVGQKKPNPWGLHDVHGNVSEWCSDWHESYGSAGISDPTGPLRGSWRIRRGGDWTSHERNCRSASRDGDEPEFGNTFDPLRQCYLGFRLALSPSESTLPEGDSK